MSGEFQRSKLEGKTKTERDRNIDYIVRDISDLNESVSSITTPPLSDVLGVGFNTGANSIKVETGQQINFGNEDANIKGDSLALNITAPVNRSLYLNTTDGFATTDYVAWGGKVLSLVGSTNGQFNINVQTTDALLEFKDAQGTGFDGDLGSSVLTANRTWRLPDASGDVALTSDISSEFTALTDTPNSYAGEAAKVAVVNDAENGIVYKLPSEAGWQYRLETTLNEAQILSMGTSPINLFNLASDVAIDYKIIMIFKMNGSTGNFGGVNLQGLVINTTNTYPTIGQNQVALINEAFIADGVNGSVVIYGQSSSLISGFEFITPIALGDGLSISTGNTVNPSNGGSDTTNCTLQIITLLNLL